MTLAAVALPGELVSLHVISCNCTVHGTQNYILSNFDIRKKVHCTFDPDPEGVVINYIIEICELELGY